MSGDFLDRAAQVRDDEALPLDRLVRRGSRIILA